MAVGTAKKSPSSMKGQKTLLSFFSKSPGQNVSSQTATPPKMAGPAPRNSVVEQSESPSTLTGPAASNNIIPPVQSAISVAAAEPTLSTPEPSSQPIPSSPTRVGRRNKRKLLIVDSDSEIEENAASDSEDDWVPPTKAEDHDEEEDTFIDDGTLRSENSDISKTPEPMFPSKRFVSRKVASSDTLTSSGPPSPASRHSPGSTDASAVRGASTLAKFSISSDYIPGKRDSSNQLPRVPEKVIVSEDPERYKWLLHIRDADGKSPDHPEYDPRTIYVPNSAWAKFTPFEKQYWEVKQNLWNTVVFFKKGKFYELYENDAEIAHRLFDLKLAGGGRANMSLCGVPEMSFDYWASAFIAKGYKVARVDQAETALGKEMRDIANKKKEEKIIRRELSCVLTGGTLTEGTMLVSDLSQYCMSIKQEGLEFAACFVDTATSQFYISHFVDKSSDYPMLESLLAQVRPKELILPRGNLEKYALKIVKNNTSVDTLWELVKPDVEFWDASTARREVDLDTYFRDDPEKAPKALTESLSSDLAASAIGGLVWYLRSLKLDKQLLSLGQFDQYDATSSSHGSTLVLDGQTLQNLEVFANSWDGGSEGTLFKLINRCITPFGKRRLRSWIAHPLQRSEDIARRADAIDMFMAQNEVAAVLSDKLVGLPDAERMLSRVHAGSLKPKDFVKLVGGLESMARILSWLDGLRNKLPQLEPFVGSATSSSVTALEETIEPWMTAFDHLQAKTNDTLVPEPGVDEDFDTTREHVVNAEHELHEILKVYRNNFKTNNIEYRDSGKEIYLIEVPVKYVKQVPHDWQQMGSTSKFKRYWSPEVKTLVRSLQEAQERHKLSSQATQQKLYAKFCSRENYTIFVEAVRVLSAIDCLLSLARVSEGMAVHCRPEIVSGSSENTRAVISFANLRHPVAQTTDFIPNDVQLGAPGPRFSLLTGANAAGKSTVLRTTCCAILLAQMGCHVPAETARLTPVDRIMTRLGASDNIFAGKSTFHMELAETERILSEATSRSFVVLDELGRGGSSSDGFAIAEAVLHHLAAHVQCMGFFATHYATLYDSFALHPQVKPERMAISVDKDSRQVTFLYKLESGRSEGSFGMNVALMCGVAPEIVAAAEEASKVHEHTAMLKEKRNQLMEKEVPLGLLSDTFWLSSHNSNYNADVLQSMLTMARGSLPAQ